MNCKFLSDSDKDQIMGDLKFLLGNEQGRRFLGWLIVQQCGLISASYAERSDRDTAYNEGLRAVALTLALMVGRTGNAELGNLITETAQRLNELEQIRKNQEAR